MAEETRGQSDQGHGKPTLAMLAATAIWGGTFVTVKDALDASDPMTFLALRFSVGALAALALSYAGGSKPTAADWRRVLKPGLQLSVFMFGGYALQTIGLATTTPARSAFVTGLTVIFVPFVAWRLSRQRPAVRSFVAPLVAVVGLQQLTQFSFGDPVPVGDLLTVGCAVLYAGHIAWTSHVAKGLPAMPLTTIQLAMVAILSAASLPFTTIRFAPTGGYWAAVLFTGVVASAVNIAVQIWAQTKLSAVRAAVIYSLEPVFALAWAAVMGAGAPTSAELVGGAFILLAVLISEVELPVLRPALSEPVPSEAEGRGRGP